MPPPSPHAWRVSVKQAIAIQGRLASAVQRSKPVRPFRIVAGVDAAVTVDHTRCIAAAVAWDRIGEAVLEQTVAAVPVTFPYIPGLLSFREAPAVLAALKKLEAEPDVIICDAHGVAHPRRFGLACHIGVICECPAIGCAKSRLVGGHREPGIRRGSRAALMERRERVGTVLRTRTGVKPVYVSIGHRVDLETAERLVLDCAVGYLLPEPTRLADKLVRRARLRR